MTDVHTSVIFYNKLPNSRADGIFNNARVKFPAACCGDALFTLPRPVLALVLGHLPERGYPASTV
jgi:hypothetical protein